MELSEVKELLQHDYWQEGLDLIDKLWNTVYGTVERGHIGTHTEEVVLTTGGFSENEEAIDVIASSMFFMLYWQKSERGGKYTFRRSI